MSFSDRQIQNLFEIGKIVYTQPDPCELCTLLATRVCPEGELAKIYLARLEEDGIFRTLASFGYARETNINEFTTDLNRDIPLVDAYLRSEVITLNRRELAIRYPNFETIDKRSPWKSLAITPTISGGLVFIFRLQVPLSEYSHSQQYFEAIAMILSFYKCAPLACQKRRDLQISIDPKAVDHLEGRPLTSRQRTILALIQEGLTNYQIAGSIGYSESLVKQETIIIYSKMGVRGRVDLRAESILEKVSR